MSIFTAARISRAPIAGLFAVGLVWGGWSSVVPAVKARIGANDAEFGSALVFMSVGSIVAMAIAPRLAKALGTRALPLMGVGLCLAFFFPILAPDVWTLGLAMFGMGVTVVMVDITSNVQISSLEARHKMHLMGVCHGMFSVGFALSAITAAWARTQGFAPAQIFPALSAVALLLTFAMRSAEPAAAAEADPGEAGRHAGKTPWPAILLTALVLFAAFVGENATEAWSALHIERTLHAPAGQGGLGPFMLGLSMAAGRFGGHIATARFGEARLIVFSSVFGVIGSLVIGMAPTREVALVGVGILGLGMSVIVPAVNSILGRHVTEEQRAHAISRAWMVGMVGFFLAPAMMGGIAELTSLRWSFVLVSLIVAAAIPAVIRLDRL